MKKATAYSRFFASLRTAILALIALGGLSMCGKNDVVPDEEDPWIALTGDSSIRFSSTLDATATKDALDDGTTFGVFAFYQPGTSGSPGAWNSSRTPNFMYNEDVLYSGGTYTYSPIKYWPNNTYNTISFWAYCPYTANPDSFRTSSSDLYSKTTGDIPYIRFSVVNDGSVDLMTSDILKSLPKPNDNSPVHFTFHHVLSLIDINVKKQDAETPRFIVKLKSVRFDGIYQTGIICKFDWNSLSDNDRNFTAFSGDQTLSTSLSPMGGVMLIPQSFTSNEAKLHVEYSIQHAGGVGPERPLSCEALLSEVFEDGWENNKHYTLNITIIPNDPIEFSVEWSDWGDVYNWHITS